MGWSDIAVVMCLKLKPQILIVWQIMDFVLPSFITQGDVVPPVPVFLLVHMLIKTGIGHMMNDKGLAGYRGDLGK